MKRRQPVPSRWLIADHRTGNDLWAALRRLPSGSGVLFLYRDMPKGRRARLLAKVRIAARLRGLILVDEGRGEAARVHDLAELRRASIRRTPLLFVSPIFPTRSHPRWRPLTAMRAAAMIRLAYTPVIALGGMNERRFRRVERLGFHGWAGIDAWIRT
jgi:thiamine-phosphate pyrophosphorylase